MLLTSVLIYLAIGSFAGLSAGLLGVGGGMIIVPGLLIVFEQLGFGDSTLTHMAIGTSLATIVFTSLSSIRSHNMKKAVNWPLVLRISIGIIIGAQIGAFLADGIRGAWLEFLLGIFSIVVAIQMGLKLSPNAQRHLPGKLGMTSMGTFIGGFSSLVGIGGGSLSVPYLSWCNVPMQTAVGSSSAIGFPIALSGALGFIYNGWSEPGLPEYALGYVYLPALAGIVCSSVIFATFGAKLAHWLPADQLKKVFSVFLLLIGVRILIGSGII